MRRSWNAAAFRDYERSEAIRIGLAKVLGIGAMTTTTLAVAYDAIIHSGEYTRRGWEHLKETGRQYFPAAAEAAEAVPSEYKVMGAAAILIGAAALARIRSVRNRTTIRNVPQIVQTQQRRPTEREVKDSLLQFQETDQQEPTVVWDETRRR